MANYNDRGKVLVLGNDVTKPPLLDSIVPQAIIIKDAFDDPMFVIERKLSNDTWAFTTRNDPEFCGVLLDLGLRKLAPTATVESVITDGVEKHLDVEERV